MQDSFGRQKDIVARRHCYKSLDLFAKKNK